MFMSANIIEYSGAPDGVMSSRIAVSGGVESGGKSVTDAGADAVAGVGVRIGSIDCIVEDDDQGLIGAG